MKRQWQGLVVRGAQLSILEQRKSGPRLPGALNFCQPSPVHATTGRGRSGAVSRAGQRGNRQGGGSESAQSA